MWWSQAQVHRVTSYLNEIFLAKRISNLDVFVCYVEKKLDCNIYCEVVIVIQFYTMRR